jgi:parallel beta-helix repeat protein
VKTTRIIFALLCVMFQIGPLEAARQTQLSSAPEVFWSAATRTITVGRAYSAADPLEAPYRGLPSHPDAPKAATDLASVASALAELGVSDALTESAPGVWLLNANLTIRQTALLTLTASALNELRIASGEPITQPYVVKVQGGWMYAEGIRIRSWLPVSGTVDTDISDGRPYLLAYQGGRLDLVRADVSYLGWETGEESGLAFRQRADNANPASGATGNIFDSRIYGMYYGFYSYEAVNMRIEGNDVFDNIGYGIDPHDDSTGLVVAKNRVYRNGNHGIIFSRGCDYNTIRENEVFDNAGHGIMLDRGSDDNTVFSNTVRGNQDGIAVFQSSRNRIESNTIVENSKSGVRLNASYDSDDVFDEISLNNQVINNTITGNGDYGVYLYQRAVRNTIADNQVTDNRAGMLIRSGGNTLTGNVIQGNGYGIAVQGGEPNDLPVRGPPIVPAPELSGDRTRVQGNLIEANRGPGVRLISTTLTLIGSAFVTETDTANTIRFNDGAGIDIGGNAVSSTVQGNVIHVNGSHGVSVSEGNAFANRITRNSITANGGSGIRLLNGGNANVSAPGSLTFAAGVITGTAQPGADIEVYRDPDREGEHFVGSTTANASGVWSLTLPPDDDPFAGRLSALAIDALGNTSSFGSVTAVPDVPYITVSQGASGQPVVLVSGAGTTATLPLLRAGLDRLGEPARSYLLPQGDGVWLLRASLFVAPGATLHVAAPDARWLRIAASPAVTSALRQAAATSSTTPLSLITHGGVLIFEDVKVSSWVSETGDYDRVYKDGRPYVLAKYDARMDIRRSEMAFLGYGAGESYGLSWRDINDSAEPDVLRTRVTGEILSSTIHNLYFGFYSYQAQDIVVRGSVFRNNVSYGFDPHDYSHGFVVEDNDFHDNGNHGFIISRGVNNFVVRNNRSYNNRYTVDSRDRAAHGFMLDPGSPTSVYAQVPSFDNLLVNNQAWGNDGYGLRVLGSVSNTIRNNAFFGNEKGLTVEGPSSNNLFERNTITGNLSYGAYLFDRAHANRFTENLIEGNGGDGILIRTNGNLVSGNVITGNGVITNGSGIEVLAEQGDNGAAVLVINNVLADNQIGANSRHGVELKGALSTTVSNNVIVNNDQHGVYMTGVYGEGSRHNLVRNNTVYDNRAQGIRAHGSTTRLNAWNGNRVYDNVTGGIILSGGANDGVTPPVIVTATATLVTGTAPAGTVVEIYSDVRGQGRFVEGTITADLNGRFEMRKPTGFAGPNINASLNNAGNASAMRGHGRMRTQNIFMPFVGR